MPHDPDQVYQPEADTFLLLEAALDEITSGDRVLEIGTGSGYISAALTGRYDIVATDINPHAVLCARDKGVDVVRGDLFSGIRGTFSLILFNPPYLPTLPEERIDDWFEFALDGGENGRAVIERFAVEAGRVLAPGGRCLVLISSLTGLQEVCAIFAQYGFLADVALQQTMEDDEVLYVLRVVRAVVPSFPIQ